MKLAVTGKGGVGKTTISALMAFSLKSAGHSVIAIDADPDSNLLACMGYPHPESISPIVELKDLIEERTGVKPGTTGSMFKLNPRVDDIPEKYSVNVDGIKVLVAGAVKKGGSGCYCPENALVRTLVSHILLDKNTTLVLDMEAGIEHLGRGTITAVDKLFVVVEPGRRSLETALRIKGLAKDLGLQQISVIGNKIRNETDEERLKHSLNGIDFTGFIPYSDQLRIAEFEGRSIATASTEVNEIISKIIKTI